jgi:hypothetical protein
MIGSKLRLQTNERLKEFIDPSARAKVQRLIDFVGEDILSPLVEEAMSAGTDSRLARELGLTSTTKEMFLDELDNLLVGSLFALGDASQFEATSYKSVDSASFDSPLNEYRRVAADVMAQPATPTAFNFQEALNQAERYRDTHGYLPFVPR